MKTPDFKFVPHEMKTSIIKVTSYKDKNFRGLFYNPYFKTEKVFENLTQFFLLTESLHDKLGFPERSMEKRLVRSNDSEDYKFKDAGPADLRSEVIATFKISVIFRQNASWQGNLGWVERGVETNFRSVLELVLLFDNILGYSDSP